MATLSSPTLSRLILEVRTILNQPDPKNSRWSDPELTMYLNDAVRRYFLEISDRNEGQFDKSTPLDLVANTETVPLPSDFFEVRALYKVTPNENRILSYENNVTDGYVTAGNNSALLFEPYYFFRDGNLVLRPAPAFSETAGLLLHYVAFPTTLLWGGDVLTDAISPVFKEMVVMCAVHKAKVSESLVVGTDTSALARDLLKTLEAQFRDTIGLRSKYPVSVKPFNP